MTEPKSDPYGVVIPPDEPKPRQCPCGQPLNLEASRAAGRCCCCRNDHMPQEAAPAPRTAPDSPAPVSQDPPDGDEALRARLAEVLCPPHHRYGPGGMTVVADGTMKSWMSALTPCPLHDGEAAALLPLVLAYGREQRAAGAEEALREAANAAPDDDELGLRLFVDHSADVNHRLTTQQWLAERVKRWAFCRTCPGGYEDCPECHGEGLVAR